MTELLYYQSRGAMVCTSNQTFARQMARKIMQRSIVLFTLPAWKVKKFKPKFKR